jgi:hypothetical protein
MTTAVDLAAAAAAPSKGRRIRIFYPCYYDSFRPGLKKLPLSPPRFAAAAIDAAARILQ